MSENEKIDFEQYEWQENWPTRYHYFVNQFNRFSIGIYGRDNILPPLGYFPIKDPINIGSNFRESMNRYKTMYLCDVVKAIGIEDQSTYASLQHHWKRIQQYNNLVLPISYVLTFVIFFIGMFSLFEGLLYLYGPDSDIPDMFISSAGFSLLIILIWVLYQILRRFVAFVLNQYYGDTNAVVSAIYFTVELLRKSALDSSSNRRHLQKKLDSLAKHLLQLASQFRSESPEDQAWIHSHFKAMERFVREHEHVIVAPKTDSLDVLRQDFYHLMKILIAGNYGEFAYEYQPSTKPEAPKANRIVGIILGFVGFIIPSLVLYILYSNPQRIANMGINVNTVALVSLAWLLLTIDATLKLGIVDRVTGLAKTIRDLG
jgi:hypothetical protein